MKSRVQCPCVHPNLPGETFLFLLEKELGSSSPNESGHSGHQAKTII